jgi:hypothetical protein
MINPEELKNLVYALTLAVRKSKRTQWIEKGFSRVNQRKDFLLNYWVCRLAKNDKTDLALYQQILNDYNTVMLNTAKTAENFKNSEESETSEQNAAIRSTSAKELAPPTKPEVDGRSKQILATPAQMIASAGTAAVNWIKGGLQTLSEDKVQKRLDICKSCEFWDSSALNGTGRCRKCGCSTWAKIRMPAEQCPDKKWLAETE